MGKDDSAKHADGPVPPPSDPRQSVHRRAAVAATHPVSPPALEVAESGFPVWAASSFELEMGADVKEMGDTIPGGLPDLTRKRPPR